MFRREVTPRALSQISGYLSSMTLSLGPIVRLMTRSIHLDIAIHPVLDTEFLLSTKCIEEISFWNDSIDENNGYEIKHSTIISQIIFTDASSHSYGGYILQRLGKIICHGKFDSYQQATSSTERELLAIKYCLESFAQIIRHEEVNVRTDNQAASIIIEVGSSREHLQKVAVQIFELCVTHDIKLSATWIPRQKNQIADYYSKMTDSDDFSICHNTFRQICEAFGQPDYDRFADGINRRSIKFNSKYYCPDTNGVNAFTQDWSDANLNLISLLIKHIVDTIKHLESCKAKGILLVPQWPSSHFWTFIHNGLYLHSYIKKFIVVKPFYTSPCEHCIFQGFMNFNTLALLIDFS